MALLLRSFFGDHCCFNVLILMVVSCAPGHRSRSNRPAALAIKAFNVETAAIKDAVRGNVIPGRMRMQWWKDSMAGATKLAL